MRDGALAVVGAGAFALLLSEGGLAALLGALVGVAVAAVVLRRDEPPATVPESILEAACDGLLVLDERGTVVRSSAKATSLVDGTDGIWLDAFAPDAQARLRHALEPSPDDESATEPEVLSDLATAGPSSRRFRACVQRREGAGAVIALVDETEAVSLEALRSELLSMVTHEIRDPLSTVRGFAQMLMVQGIPADQASELVEAIHRESNRMVNLANDFLDVSRVESGSHPVARAPVDLGPLIESTVGDLAPLAHEKSITLSRETGEELPPVWADRKLLEQVLINLISNAIKYSPDQSRVRVGASAGPGAVEVSVEDDGVGIPEEALPRLFDKFYRVRGDDHGEVMGTGLGLSLAKRIIELHEGTIEAESTLGQGSCFRFTVPIDLPGASRAPAAPGPEQGAPGP